MRRVTCGSPLLGAGSNCKLLKKNQSETADKRHVTIQLTRSISMNRLTPLWPPDCRIDSNSWGQRILSLRCDHDTWEKKIELTVQQ